VHSPSLSMKDQHQQEQPPPPPGPSSNPRALQQEEEQQEENDSAAAAIEMTTSIQSVDPTALLESSTRAEEDAEPAPETVATREAPFPATFLAPDDAIPLPLRGDDDGSRSTPAAVGYSFLGDLQRRHRASLSRAPSTPRLMLLLLPLLSLGCHALFFYGQSATMWRLHLSKQVNVWVNATTFESREAMDTLGRNHSNHIVMQSEKDVKEFTYLYAIQELWKAAHMPGKLLPRAAAVLLILFSGVWPHLKLLLLNFTWLFATNGPRRTRLLHWLSTLGKWSLADVLVVCVMVGVLHLDWVVDPQATKDGLEENLPYVISLVHALYTASDLCTMALPFDCHVNQKNWSKWSQCKGCVAFVKMAVDHPSTARSSFQGFFDGLHVSGGGLVSLRVHGLGGIYVFCSAVILSILISLAVDIWDVRAQQQQQATAWGGPHELALDTDNDDNGEEDDEDNDGDSYEDFHTHFQYRQRLESAGQSAYDGLIRQTEELEQSRWRKYAVWCGCVVATILVTAGVWSMSIERRVYGAIPHTLQSVLGIEWDQKYSLMSLVKVTGAAKGYDYLLMGTFGLFMVLGPLIRVGLCVLASLCPCASSSRARRALLASMEFIGAFCAWEVLVAAVGMVDLLMPSITSTVILSPDCAQISPDGSCLSVEFNLLDPFATVLLGGLVLVALANYGYGSRRHLVQGESPPDESARYDLVRGSDTRLRLTA
jgi:hypothetical protein